MTPKRKTTSSESTTSSSSGSSSSSSSSSGSESSSSDSDNSSSSANSQKVSDTERAKKKVPFPVVRHGRPKSETGGVPPAEIKGKEKSLPKSRPVVYSSESEESPSKLKSTKRKVPAKPKATATIAPVPKAQRSGNKAPSGPSPHKNVAGAKTVVNKPGKATGNTGVTKIAEKTTKTAAEPLQKKLKKKSIFSPENSSESDAPSPTKASSGPKVTTSPVKGAKPPQSKAKGGEIITKPRGVLATRVALVVKQQQQQQQQKSESSGSSKSCSGGSGVSASSGTTESSSDSESSESAVTPQPIPQPPPQHKKKEVSTGAASAASTTSAVSAGASGPLKKPSGAIIAAAVAKQQYRAPKRQGLVKSEDDGEASDSDKEVEGDENSTKTAAKGKRKLQPRKGSKHLQLQAKATSDTESDTAESKRSTSKSPVKRTGPSTVVRHQSVPGRESGGSGGRGSQGTHTRARGTIKDRECPLAPSCDSRGHLSGRFDSHFTLEACPLYHNTTPQACLEFYKERKKRDEERKKALTNLGKKSPKGLHQTNEQRNYQLKVKELRSKWKGGIGDGNESGSGGEQPGVEKDRQPRLTDLTPDYDLKLFMESQAIASEKIERELRELGSGDGAENSSRGGNGGGTRCVEMGRWEMEVWYQSPYPEEFSRAPKLYLCEFCLRYAKSRQVLRRHRDKCLWRHPPGHEVYRKDKIGVWEVDGKRYKQYCQNLCLLAKFFLDHKTLYYDVEPFLFYVMTIGDAEGCHTVGYFSKEKNSFLNYNVSCILTLPPYQRQGYGRLLIDFSYLLTRVEKKIGSPEKPLSDLGLISYRSYWKDVLLQYLCNFGGKELSVKDISKEMAIDSYDIVSTLQALGMMKYWKGKHIILKKQDVIDDYKDRVKRRPPVYKEIDPDCLKWNPFQAPKTPSASN